MEINANMLVTQTKNPEARDSYRPISQTNHVYKIITSILVNGLANTLLNILRKVKQHFP